MVLIRQNWQILDTKSTKLSSEPSPLEKWARKAPGFSSTSEATGVFPITCQEHESYTDRGCKNAVELGPHCRGKRYDSQRSGSVYFPEEKVVEVEKIYYENNFSPPSSSCMPTFISDIISKS